MSQQPLIYLSEASIIIAALVLFVAIILSSMYDIRAIAMRKLQASTIRELTYRHQPHVTIVVIAHNNAATILQCLKSIAKSRYKQYDVVVIDNASHDETPRLLRNYRGKFALKLCLKRKTSKQIATFLQGYGKSEKGETIVRLQGNDIIAPTFLKACAAHFVANDTVEMVQFGKRLTGEWGILFLLSTVKELLMSVVTKCYSITHVTMKRQAEQSVVAYRRSILARKYIDKARWQYDAKTVSAKVGSAYSSTLSLKRVLLSIFAVGMMSYFFYVAATLQSSSLLVLSWLIVSTSLLIIVWSDDTSLVSEKMQLTVSIPTIYFLAYGLLMANLVITFARIIKYLAITSWRAIALAYYTENSRFM